MENITDQNLLNNIFISKEFWSALIGAVVGAFLAFWLNRKLNKIALNNENRDTINSIAIDSVIILNNLIDIQKQIVLPRQKELSNFELSPQNFVFKESFLFIQGTVTSFTTDIKKLSFITKYNINVLNIVLILNNHLVNLEKIINELNQQIRESVKNKQLHNSLLVSDIEIIKSITNNFINHIESTLAFANIASDLLIGHGKKIFKSEFKGIKYCNYNDLKFTGTLPANYEYLRRDPPQEIWYAKIKNFILDLIW